MLARIYTPVHFIHRDCIIIFNMLKSTLIIIIFRYFIKPAINHSWLISFFFDISISDLILWKLLDKLSDAILNELSILQKLTVLQVISVELSGNCLQNAISKSLTEMFN